MSLINDALRKARQEAADREDSGDGPDIFSLRQPQSGHVPFSTGMILGAVIASIAALGGAAIVWWGFGQKAETPSPIVVAAHEAGKDIPSLIGTVDNPPTPPVTLSPASETAPATPDSAPDVGPDGQPDEISETVVETPPGLPEGDAEALFEKLSAAPETRSKNEFVETAKLGETTLRLDYIVFRTTDPFAEINDLEVHEGSYIEGYQVEKIAVDRVVLRNDEGAITLRVH